MEAEKSEKKVECPECEQEFNPTEDMKPPNLFMRNALSVIKLKCSLSGCAKIFKYDNFITHVAQCSINTMEVKCKHCKQLYKKREEEEHIFGCIVMRKQTVYGHFLNDSYLIKDWEHNIHYRGIFWPGFPKTRLYITRPA